MVNEEWLTVQEAADRLKVHPETIRVWLRDGRLKGAQPINKRVGWRIPISEILRLLVLPCPDCHEAVPIVRGSAGEVACGGCGQRLVTNPYGAGMQQTSWNRGERVQDDNPKAAA